MQTQPFATIDTHGLTTTGSMLGTPRYMSPEQIERPRDVDARSDVWSMGVVMYKCLTGRCPHDDTETLGAMLVALMTKPSPPVQSLAPWVSRELAAVVHRALERDPKRRFASAAEMLEALRELSPAGFALRADELVSLDEERKLLLGSLAPLKPTDSMAPETIDMRADTGPQARPAPPPPRSPPRPRSRSVGEVVGSWGTRAGMAVIAPLAAVSNTLDRLSRGGAPRKAKFRPYFRPRKTAGTTASWRDVLPGLTVLFAFLALGLGGWLVLKASALPPALGLDAPPTAVSAGRAGRRARRHRR